VDKLKLEKDFEFSKVVLLLNRKQKSKLVLSAILQSCLGFLDLLGIALIGLLGAITAEVVKLDEATGKVLTFLKMLKIENWASQSQVTLIAALAGFVLIFKTIVSVILTKKNLRFLSNLSATISGLMIRQLMAKEITKIREKEVQTYVFAITEGVNAIMIGVLSTLWILASDISLLLILGISLFLFNPLTAVTSTIFFGTIGFLLYLSTRSKLQKLGSDSRELTIQSNQTIVEAINAYRELLVKNQRSSYASSFLELRQRFTRTQAEIAFMPHLSKYVFESSLIMGGLLISGMQFALYDSQKAITTMTVFIASSSRIVPALLRIQYSLIQLNTNKGVCNSALQLISEFGLADNMYPDPIERVDLEHTGFNPRISIENVSFTYTNSSSLTLDGINLEIPEGKFIAIVGPSGAGKSTLIELILGIHLPDSGEVLISGKSPRDVYEIWPGAVSYLPQEVYLINSTIRKNVTFPFIDLPEDEVRIKNSLELANFGDEYRKLGDQEKIGEDGSKLSGGQRQRLGMARALYSNPSLLVLDEATSSLDADSEFKISQTLKTLHGKVTILVIAHRLSTVRNADEIVYLESGKVVATGTFEELRLQVPEFDRQANLMGMNEN
jgi:ABC-type multidrug transport system fused ATPase/permease subunit